MNIYVKMVESVHYIVKCEIILRKIIYKTV